MNLEVSVQNLSVVWKLRLSSSTLCSKCPAWTSEFVAFLRGCYAIESTVKVLDGVLVDLDSDLEWQFQEATFRLSNDGVGPF